MRRGSGTGVAFLLVVQILAASSGQAAPAPGPQPVRVAVPASNIALSPVFLADAHGYYRRHGLAAAVLQIDGSTATSAALQAGDIEFEVTGAAPFLLSVANGLPFLAIAAIDVGFTSQLVVSTRYLATHPVARADSVAQRVAVLQGATLGMISATDIATVKYLFQFAGLPVSDLRPMKLQNQVAGIAALQYGRVDALILSPPQSFAAEARGFGRIVLNTRDVPGLETVPYDVAATTRAYAQGHPGVVRAFLAALEEALAEVARRTPAVLEYERARYPTLPSSAVKQGLDFVRLTPYELMRGEQWRGLEKFLMFGGQLQTPYTAQEGRDWTNAFMPTGRP